MDMKKTIIAFSMSALLLTSCGTYTGQGAYVGAQFGTILGSAVGGISGGWRSRDAGAIIGMAGGAAIGAAIGAAADQREADRYEGYRRERAARQNGSNSSVTPPSDDSGYDKVPKTGQSNVFVLMMVVVVTAAVCGGLYVYNKKSKENL